MAGLSKLPGPKALPWIGTAWTYFPVFGSDSTKCLHQSYLRKYLKYGKVVCENVAGRNIVSVYDPNDMFTVFQNEGRWPTRLSHEVLLTIRREHGDLYASGGLVPTNGEEWGRLRSSFQKHISNPQLIARYAPILEETSREFIAFLWDSCASRHVIPDLLNKMHEWALENVCVAVLDTRLDRFRAQRNPIVYDLITCGRKFLFALNDAEHFPLWHLYKTRSYKTVAAMEFFFYGFARFHVQQKLEKIKRNNVGDDGKEVLGSVLENYLRNPQSDIRDVITMASDLVFAGLLTTAFSTSFVLYHLSRNPAQQEKLFQEIRKHFSSVDNPIDVSHLNEMKYLKACVRESLRLNPVSLGTGRLLPNDVCFSGFAVPAGTVVLTQNQVASRLSEYVPDPLSYRPERWLHDRNKRHIHPYLVLPFGAGPRACIGRRFAELEMYIFLILLLNRFRLEWVGEDGLKTMSSLLNIPVGQLNVRITPR